MDVQMPHCDGYKATQLIRKHGDPTIRNILIIAMTASAIEGDREKCLASGMNNYLAKPVKPNTLKALLESYLSKESEEELNLQQEANKIVKEALSTADRVGKPGGKEKTAKDGVSEPKERPRSVRMNTAQRIVPEATASQTSASANSLPETGS